MIDDIKAAARQRLATEGPDLSLRAVARDIGVVSSAVYRYFASRDELLTALIIDAYDDLGEAVERGESAAPRRDLTARWMAFGRSVRSWALEHPHEYALLYGSPVPGYRAPQTTVGPAARVAFALASVARDAWARGEIDPTDDGAEPVAGAVARDAANVAEAIGLDAPPDVAARMLVAWTQLFGMLSFELFGHLIGSVDDNDAFFDHATATMARYVGLRG